MENFLLDPNFPDQLLESSKKRTAEFIQILSDNFSKHGLAKKTSSNWNSLVWLGLGLGLV
jgi:hypothetical protein